MATGKQQWVKVAIGGRGWWRRMCYGLGGCLERRRMKNRIFHTEEHIYNLQISLSELVLLGGSPLLALSANFCA